MLETQEVLLEDISICDPYIASFTNMEPGSPSITASPGESKGHYTVSAGPGAKRLWFREAKDRYLWSP